MICEFDDHTDRRLEELGEAEEVVEVEQPLFSNVLGFTRTTDKER